MTKHVTLRQRHIIYQATVKLVQLLRRFVEKNPDDFNLTPMLLKRVVNTAMTCPGFTVVQKDDIAHTSGLDEMQQRSFGQPRFAEDWVHFHALVPKPGIPLDVLEVSRRSAETCLPSSQPELTRRIRLSSGTSLSSASSRPTPS